MAKVGHGAQRNSRNRFARHSLAVLHGGINHRLLTTGRFIVDFAIKRHDIGFSPGSGFRKEFRATYGVTPRVFKRGR